jgi:iron complex outermembrane receptor protein
MRNRSVSQLRVVLHGTAALLLLVATMRATGASSGDSASGAASDAPAEELAEVVVSAQKRLERIQDVPLSVSSLSGEQMAHRGVKDLVDLASAVPGVSFSDSQSGRGTFAIRGISTTTEVPTVELFVDDIPISSRFNEITGAADPDILDIERVEVLKGPQGTLYGGSAMGGAIKFVTHRPDTDQFHFEASGEGAATHDGDPELEARAAVNIPLVDEKLGLRIAGLYRNSGGYIDRIAGGTALDQNQAELDSATGRAVGLAPDGRPLQTDPATGYATSVPPATTVSPNTVARNDINSSRRVALRATALFAADDSLRIIPAFYYQRNTVDDFSYFWGNLPGLASSERNQEPSNDTMKLYSLTLEKDFSGVSLTSISSFRDRDQRFGLDYSFYIGGLVSDFAALPSDSAVNSHFEYATQEIRLASSGNTRVRWTTGLFYQHEKDDYGFTVRTVGTSALGIPPLHGVPDIVYQTGVVKDLNQYAAFGEITVALTGRLDVTAGGRAFRFEQSIDRLAEGILAGGSFAFQGKTNENGLTPKVSTSYKVTPDNMLYATISKGFRAGGLNNGVPEDRCAADLARIGLSGSPNQYASDSLWNYEIGSKNRLAAGRFILNAAAFYIDWTKIQQQVALPGCGFTFTANAGQAASKGGEMELQTRITDGWTLDGAVTATDAKITSSAPGAGAKDGDRVLTTPKWIFQLNTEYRHSTLGQHWWFVRGEYQYRTSQWRSFDRFLCRLAPGAAADPQRPACAGADEVPVANPSQIQAGYGYANVAVGLENDRWTAQVFANNLSDARPTLDRSDLLFIDQRSTLRPRTIGLRVQTQF